MAVWISSCNTKEKSASAKKDFFTDNLDTTISPAQDFFQYANGGWIKRNPIPPEESTWGVGNLVQEDIYSRLRKINEDAAAKNAANGTVEQKIGDFWFSSMDSTSIDQQGLQPLQADL
jgi:putative endopeptidase